MDKSEDRVLLLTGCLLLFQIIDFFFKLLSPSSLDLSFNNLNPIVETNTKFFLIIVAFHHLQLQSCLFVLSQKLRHWVKPRSIKWFFRFLLIEYDDDRWVKNFRMTKSTLFRIVNQLWPYVDEIKHPLSKRNSC
jgi:hypothetical protein